MGFFGHSFGEDIMVQESSRRHFQDELRSLESTIQAMGAAAQDLLESALLTLTSDDPELPAKVIRNADEVDGYYLRIENRIMDLFALQTPVAGDLRFLTALLHVNLHLERIGDMAVNIAKIAELAAGLPRHALVLQHLEEMGAIALRMLEAAMDAFSRRDLELCLRLPDMDDPIDHLNRGMFEHIIAMSDDKRLLEWGIRMHVVSRQLERVGDHAVDIGEQVAFLITGEFREFTDASHPEIVP
jgi:phosphate transport system protein